MHSETASTSTSDAIAKFTPDEHSRLVGGSTAARRMACPGSYKLELEVPDSLRKHTTSSYAEEGTALHNAMAYILTENVIDLDTLIGMDFVCDDAGKTLALTRKHVAEAIVPAVAFFEELCDRLEEEGGLEFVVETRVEVPGIPGAFGTSDVIFRTRKRSGIIDWKFGAGRPVFAEYGEGDKAAGNPQLMFYARGGVHTLPHMFTDHATGKIEPDWPVELFICQPLIDEERGKRISRHTTTVAQLDDFRWQLVAAIAEAVGDAPRIAAGSHCDFAICKAICPRHNGPLLDLTKMHAANALDKATTDELSDDDYGARLAMILDLFDVVEPLAREAMKQATVFMEDGFTVPGWKLVAKRPGHDSWKDDDKADKYLARQGLDVNARRVVKPITPAAARKVLKAMGKALDEKYVEPGTSSGVNVVREESARPAVETYRTTAAKLGAKLAALGG